MHLYKHSEGALSNISLQDSEIMLLDPLKADNTLRALPKANQAKDTKTLTQFFSFLLPHLDDVSRFSYPEALAAMRDVGIVLGSLKRHHIEPQDVLPLSIAVLKILSQKTNLPPRDTLLHYTIWNPTDGRMRTYTGTDDEKYLIKSVQMAFPALNQAIYLMKNLHGISFTSPQFAQVCQEVVVNLEQMVGAIVMAYRNVSTEFFAHELRFYYDPILVGDQEYLGPGAVEMPMFVFDQLLWASDCQDLEYKQFQRGYLPYIMPQMRKIYREMEGQKSLVSKLHSQKKYLKPEQFNLLTKELGKIQMVLKSFRMPHKKMAEDAYAHSNQTQKHVGSGGYSTNILSKINNLMIDAFGELVKEPV